MLRGRIEYVGLVRVESLDVGIPQFVPHVFEEFNGIGSLLLDPSRRIFHDDELGGRSRNIFIIPFTTKGSNPSTSILMKKTCRFWSWRPGIIKKVRPFFWGGGENKDGRRK